MSSAAYTLHVSPYAAPGDAEALQRADLVRDGFSWGAFLVPMLWFFRHRHLGLGLGALAAVAGLALVLWAIGCRTPAIVAAEVALHLLFGFEGASLRRWAYDRRGRPEQDVVCAADLAEAETKSFGRWLAAPAAVAAATPPRRDGSFGRAASEPVIGMFPDPEWRR